MSDPNRPRLAPLILVLMAGAVAVALLKDGWFYAEDGFGGTMSTDLSGFETFDMLDLLLAAVAALSLPVAALASASRYGMHRRRERALEISSLVLLVAAMLGVAALVYGAAHPPDLRNQLDYFAYNPDNLSPTRTFGGAIAATAVIALVAGWLLFAVRFDADQKDSPD